MWNRSKYDVMADESSGLYVSTLFFILRVRNLTLKKKRGKISESVWNKKMLKIYEELIPYIKNISHIGYETYKDLEKIDSSELIKFIHENGESVDEFKNNYLNNINDYVRILLLLAIHDKDNVEFDSSSKQLLLRIFGCKLSNTSTIENEDKLDNFSKDILDRILADNFNVSNLTNEERILLDSYHNKYMQEKIYPGIDILTESNERIMKEVRSLARKRS